MQGAEGGPLLQYNFIYGYAPLSTSSGLVVINWYRRVLRGKLFSNGTMFPAQRIRPQPLDDFFLLFRKNHERFAAKIHELEF